MDKWAKLQAFHAWDASSILAGSTMVIDMTSVREGINLPLVDMDFRFQLPPARVGRIVSAICGFVANEYK